MIKFVNYILRVKKPTAKVGIFGCITQYEKMRTYFQNIEGIDYVGNSSGLEMQNEIRRYLQRQIGMTALNSSQVGFYFKAYSEKRILIPYYAKSKNIEKCVIVCYYYYKLKMPIRKW